MLLLGLDSWVKKLNGGILMLNVLQVRSSEELVVATVFQL